MSMRGGIRLRLLQDSARLTVAYGLKELGWFDANRRHHPIHMVSRPNDWDELVEPNSISVTAESVRASDLYLGGDVQDRVRFYVDFFAENDVVGSDLIHDVRDLLLGMYPNLNPAECLRVYDLRSATPSGLTTLDLEMVTIDRPNGFPRPWQKYWWVLRFEALDEYADESSPPHYVIPQWQPGMFEAWHRISEMDS